jgi:hypothetical protein
MGQGARRGVRVCSTAAALCILAILPDIAVGKPNLAKLIIRFIDYTIAE